MPPLVKDIETGVTKGVEVPTLPAPPRDICVVGAGRALDAFAPNVDDKLEAVGAALETIFAWGIRSADGNGGGCPGGGGGRPGGGKP